MKSFAPLAAVTAFAALVAAQSSSTASAAAAPTEVTDCHLHGDTPYCFDESGEEWQVEDVTEEDLADDYTDCHSHGADELHCSSPEETTLVAASASEEEGHDQESHDEESHEHEHEHGHSSNGTSTSNSTSSSTGITEVNGCHAHDDAVYCFDSDNAQWELEDVAEADAADEYTDCHLHGSSELHCASPDDVTLAATTGHSDEHSEGDADHTHSTTESGETTTESGSPSPGASEEASEQTDENLASAAQLSSALVMLGAAVAALCVF